MAWKRMAAISMVALAVGVGLAGPGGASGTQPPGPPPTGPVAVPSPHGAPPEIEQAVVDATRAFLREDAARAREALDRIEAGCRRLEDAEDVADILPDLVTYDRAFHAALSMSRELAGKGDVTRAFDQFVWVQKGCRTCHGIARDPRYRAPHPRSAPAR